MTDDYAPAIDAPAETAPVADAADVVALHAEDSGGPKVKRGMSDATRALMAKIVEAHKAPAEAKPAAETPAPAAAAATPAATPPTPTPDAEAASRAVAAQLELRAKALAEREAALAERAKAMPDREKFIEKPAATLKAWLREAIGAESDGEANEALADLITELSAEAGVPIDPAIRLQVEQRKATRSVKALKSDLARREAEATERAKKLDAERQEANAVASLRHALSSPEHRAKYPTLSAEDAPHDLVWSVIKAKFARDGVAPAWETAAQEAEDYLANQARAYIAKRQHVISSTSSKPTTAPQSAPQTKRAEPAAATPAAVPDDEPMSREERRRRSLSALVGKFAQ